MNTLSIEMLKLRRSRIMVLTLTLSMVIVIFTSMGLGSQTTLQRFHQDPSSAWAGHIIGYVMASALLSPLQLSVIASRLADLEHLGAGWRLNAIAGIHPGTLVRIKLVILAGIVIVLKTVELCALLAVPPLCGAPANPHVGTTIAVCVGMVGTSVALAAVLLCIAARVDSQLVVLAIGVIGGFLGMAAMLSPLWLALLNPFGYYAALTPYTFADSVPIAISPHWGAWIVYLLVCAGTFFIATRTFNAKEH